MENPANEYFPNDQNRIVQNHGEDPLQVKTRPVGVGGTESLMATDTAATFKKCIYLSVWLHQVLVVARGAFAGCTGSVVVAQA